jgi:hypothetical protein
VVLVHEVPEAGLGTDRVLGEQAHAEDLRLGFFAVGALRPITWYWCTETIMIDI